METTPVAEAAGESAEKGPKAGGFLRLFGAGTRTVARRLEAAAHGEVANTVLPA